MSPVERPVAPGPAPADHGKSKHLRTGNDSALMDVENPFAELTAEEEGHSSAMDDASDACIEEDEEDEEDSYGDEYAGGGYDYGGGGGCGYEPYESTPARLDPGARLTRIWETLADPRNFANTCSKSRWESLYYALGSIAFFSESLYRKADWNTPLPLLRLPGPSSLLVRSTLVLQVVTHFIQLHRRKEAIIEFQFNLAVGVVFACAYPHFGHPDSFPKSAQPATKAALRTFHALARAAVDLVTDYEDSTRFARPMPSGGWPRTTFGGPRFTISTATLWFRVSPLLFLMLLRFFIFLFSVFEQAPHSNGGGPMVFFPHWGFCLSRDPGQALPPFFCSWLYVWAGVCFFGVMAAVARTCSSGRKL